MTYKVVGAYWSLMSQPFQHLVHIRCGRWLLRCDYFGTSMWALRKLSPHKRSWAVLQKLIFQVDLNLIGLSMISLMTVTIAAIPRSKTPNTFAWWKQVVSGRTKCHDPWKRIIVRQAFAASYLSLFKGKDRLRLPFWVKQAKRYVDQWWTNQKRPIMFFFFLARSH